MVCHPTVIKKEVNGSLQCENRDWNERRSFAKEVLTELKLKRELSLKLRFTARAGSGQFGHIAKAFIKHFSHQLQCPRNNVQSFFHLTHSKFFCCLGGKWCLVIPSPHTNPHLLFCPFLFRITWWGGSWYFSGVNSKCWVSEWGPLCFNPAGDICIYLSKHGTRMWK